MLELFSRGWSKAQEAAGQVVLVPKEWREETKGSLTTEGPEAAEEEASLSGPRWLLPEEEEGIPPIAILRLTPLLSAKLQGNCTTERPTDWVHLAWSSESARQSGYQVRSTEKRSNGGKAKPNSFQMPQSPSHLAYTPHSLGQGS